MKRLLWLSMLLLWVPGAWGDEVPYRRYTVADGLPNETIHALAQTDDGRLYVGTPAGLAVFDGRRFRRVVLPDSVDAGCICHLRAEGNAVWAGTGNGWVVKVRAEHVKRVLPKFRFVERLLLRRDTLHIITRRERLILPPGAKQPTKRALKLSFSFPGWKSPTDVGRSLTSADFGPKGRLWVVDNRLGPGRIRLDGSVDFADVPSGSHERGWWSWIRFAPNGTAFVARQGAVYQFDPTTGRLTPVPFSGYAGGFYFDSGIAYAPKRRGVARLSVDSLRALPPLDEQIGLPTARMRCILRDHEGGLWIGTDGGLLYLFAPEVRHISRIDGASLINVAHFTREARGVLWANTWGSGVIRLRPQRARFTPRGATRWSDADSRDGHMHALSGKGWFRYDSEVRQRRVAPQNGAIRGIVSREGIGYFWHDRGLYRHDPGGAESPVLLFSWKPANRDAYTHTLAPDGDVILRAGGLLLRGLTSSGTGRASVRFDTLATFPAYTDDSARYMAFDASGTAWLAFWHRGLVRVETTGDTARVKPVLPDRRMIDVTLSGDSLVFASAQNGLYVLNQRDGTLRRHLTAADGLLSTATHSAAIYGDTLYVSHSRGLTAMPVDALFRTLPPPDALLTRVERNFEDVDPQSAPRFEAGDHAVGFGFAATAFKDARHVRYQYRLTPRDTTWAAGKQGFVRYADLPPGAYRFEVRARRVDGPFGEAATYAFAIPRYFYETAWFRLLGLLMLGLAGIGAYRWRVRVLRRRQRTLEQTVEERTAQLRREKRTTEAQAERLAELDEAKNRFFANLSHEFRTPLTLILGPLKDALGGANGDLPDAHREQLGLIQRNARRLQRLIGRLLDLTKLEAGRMEIQRQPGDLVAFAEQLVQRFAPLAERNRIDLRFRPQTGRLPLSFDPDRMEQVVGNLLSNALKFTPEGGTVWVAVNARENAVSPVAEITVKDTGPGLSEKDLRCIFDRFEQIDGTTAREHEGTGLGLPLARELVEMHDGRITVESEPGFGAAFTVGLPVEEGADGSVGEEGNGRARPGEGSLLREIEDRGSTIENGQQATERTNGSPAPSHSRDPTLLIVEDNTDVRAYLRHHLDSDYTVVEAQNGKAGLEAARTHDPDLVLGDVMMPEMDGYELCKALKADEDLGTIPIIMLTAKADTPDAIEGLECGAEDYVPKPFDIGELRARIERLLASRRRLHRKFSREVRVEPTGAIAAEEEASFLEQVLAAVEEHLGEPAFSVDDLAAQMALSRRQLTRRLKDAAGETPAALIRRLRLEQAAGRLEDDGQATVAEVAYAVGYNSPSHFAKAFRKQFGCVPSAYDGAGGNGSAV